MSTRRNTEILLLIAAALPVLVLFALIGMQAGGDFSWQHLSVPGSLFALFVVTHLALRKLAPGADPVLLPVVFVLCGTGLAFVMRLSPDTSMNQIVWLFISIAAMVITLVVVRSLEDLARYKYLLMLAGLLLLISPVIPGIGREYNGSRLWLSLAGISLQPGEIARVCIILFLAAYLAENREMLSISTRRVLGIPLPDLRTLAPLLFMWALSFLVLVAEKDLGASLLFFGVFLVMVYAATGRFSYVFIGLLVFAAGAVAAYFMFAHVQTRVAIWLDPFSDAADKGYQLVQSLFALAAGGLFGAGPGRGMPTRIPEVSTDFIFSAIGEELGLLGAAAIIICFLVLIYRGLSIASRAKSDMAAFTATGLVSSLGLQLFVIVGGVSRLIPLTGITVPFVSRGGSSMLSTFLLLALLIRAGDETTGVESEMRSTGGALSVLGRVALGKRTTALAAFFSLLLFALIGNLTWIQVVRANALNNNTLNTRGLALEARNPRGAIITSDNVVLADSRANEPEKGSGRTVTYSRVYPKGTTAAHILGYYSTRYGRAGIEAAANDALTGHRSYATFTEAIDDALGRPVAGNDVVLTLDSRIQAAASKALGKRKGAIVAFDPKTGALLASVSYPTYNPQKLDAQWDKLQANEDAPLLDRSRMTLLAPGSTFKVVTLTGAYANDIATPDTQYPAPGKMDIGNAPVTNFEGGSYASLDLQTATAKSVNTVFGQVAVQLGAKKLVSQAESYGFNQKVPFDLTVKTSLMPDPAEMTEWETAWAGIGQPVGEHESPAGPQATAFQMALVASGIANDGTIMRPYVIDHIQSASGEVSPLTQTRTQRWLRACDTETVHLVQDAMKQVVASGSGAAARISGVEVAGKTGTAEVGSTKPNNAWFIGFAPADDPVVAVAVLVEGGGLGGRVAAPVARSVIQKALEVRK
ncbi:MAG: FtsW/RodA/SpoVE family cell cycle protein [Actinomycetes bacterium]|jgi:peptidoglycan glycosyltransferase|nr:FtsW/RodA/SpoVE family cell cycle protein [Actinomycetes bacterium]